MQTVKGQSMDKWLCWSGLAISAIFLLLFLLDFIFSMAGVPFLPFGGMDTVVDVLGSLCSAVLLYLSWNALREVR
jgi:hypothetical protein